MGKESMNLKIMGKSKLNDFLCLKGVTFHKVLIQNAEIKQSTFKLQTFTAIHTKLIKTNKQTNQPTLGYINGFGIFTMLLSIRHFQYATSGKKTRTSTGIPILMCSLHAL